MSLWKAIRKRYDVIGENLAFKVGNGRRSKFGRINGAVMSHWTYLFPLYLLFPHQRKLGKRFGSFRRGCLRSLFF